MTRQSISMEDIEMPRKGLGNGLDTMLGVNTSQSKKNSGNEKTKEIIK